MNTITSYTILIAPDGVNLPEGNILYPGEQIPENNSYQNIEGFYLIVRADTLANLEIYHDAFLNVRSILPNGYKFTTTGQPTWIEVDTELKQSEDEFFVKLLITGRWEV